MVTDGNDNASQISLDALTRLAQQDDILIYAIGLLTDEDKREAKKAQRALQLLTESTGGTVFYPKDVSEVDRIAHQVARDIRNQYTIAYTPTNPALDGTFRQIKLVVKAPGNPVARTRSGYYATARGQTEGRPGTRPDPDRLETAEGLQAPALAQPLPAMAHGNLVGNRGRRHHSCSLFSVFVETPRRFDALSEMGRHKLTQPLSRGW